MQSSRIQALLLHNTQEPYCMGKQKSLPRDSPEMVGKCGPCQVGWHVTLTGGSGGCIRQRPFQWCSSLELEILVTGLVE